jgi:hypothetical protein
MKVKYKDQVIEVFEGALFEVVGGNLVITPKEQEFKKGDILYWVEKNNGKNNGVYIYQNTNYDDINTYEEEFSNFGLMTDFPNVKDSNVIVRLASEREKQKLFNTLEKYGKKWNSKTKQIEDILKVGDLCIFWDDEKSEACVNYLVDIDISNTYYLDCDFSVYKNAIKCTSLEQYINFKK